MWWNSENHAEFSLKYGMKSNVGIVHSKSDRIAVRNLTKLIEMRKAERNAKITSDFHSAGKIINRIFSKFAELKTRQTNSKSEKNKNLN